MSRDSVAARRAAVVYNPVKVELAALRSAVEHAAVSARWGETAWFETTKDDTGQGAARRAVEGGASVVIAAGGDGTVRAVAEVLRGTGVALAIVPAGTGNLLARNLDLPLSSLADAAHIAFEGVERAIDIGVAALTPAGTEHCFLVMTGLGIDAAMIANTSSALKAKVGWLAYVDGTMRSLPALQRVRVRYAIGDAPAHTAHVSTILIANCGELPGNIELIPDAKIDDGLLDIAVLQPKSVFGWLMIWRKVTWENRVLRRTAFGRNIIRISGSDKRGTISYLRGASVRLVVDEPQPFELDGDAFGEVTAVTLSVDPGALVVKTADSVPVRSPRSRATPSATRAHR